MMSAVTFKELIEKNPKYLESLPKALQGLWYDNKGEWDTAHEIVQEDASDADSAWVHAYLHRKEGDLINARYWYRRSGQSESKVELDQEWEQIASSLLSKVNQAWMQMN